MRRGLRVLAGGAVALSVLASPSGIAPAPTVQACFNLDISPVLTTETGPDDARFFEGHLGIVLQGYYRRYLFVAWRTLARKPLTRAERAAFEPVDEAPASPIVPEGDAMHAWSQARSTVSPGNSSTWVRQETFLAPTYSYILNCGDSALLTAARTLEGRKATYGPGSPALTAWVEAQDAVFRNCSPMMNQPPSIPPPLGPDAPDLARADRAYQIAAAQFYAGQLADAEAGFAAIGNDPKSPWQRWGPYLAARAMIRQGTMGGADRAGDPAALQRAQRALTGIAADRANPDLARSARELLQFVRAKTEPSKVLAETAQAMSSPATDPRAFRLRLGDFEMLTRHYFYNPPGMTRTREIESARSASDLVDWLATMQGVGDDPLAHAIDRWDTTRSETWLVAALAALEPGHDREADLTSAAGAIGADSPAYPTLAFHRARLLLREGNRPSARRVLDAALAVPRLPTSSINLFKAARLMTAGTLADFLEDAVRTVVEPSGGMRSGAATLDRDSVDVLNERVPLALLRRIGGERQLPASLRYTVTLAAFTRALVLRDAETARAMIPDVSSAAPSLAAALTRLREARDDRTLGDEAAILLLAHPGLMPFVSIPSMRGAEPLTAIDDFRSNWWCGFAPSDQEVVPYEGPFLHRGGQRVSYPQQLFRSDPKELPELPFLTKAERAAAATEWQALRRVEAGPVELGRRALEWADAHQNEPRAARVLYQVVRATRYGCESAKTGEVSQAAFTRLHARYPNSPWTARTPYWFK